MYLLTLSKDLTWFKVSDKQGELKVSDFNFNILWASGMHQGEGQGGQLPHPILADQKAPPGSGGAPHYYLPHRIFDPWCIPDWVKPACLVIFTKRG